VSSTGESFTQSFSYNALGLTDTVSYPSCTHLACTQTPAPARTVQNTYVQGLLTGVSANGTSYGTISYYPNLLVSQVVHRNGVTDTQGNDPFSMRRPSSEGAAGSFASWSSGAYTYDGSGNITRIGTSSYTYDPVSRLTSGTLFDGPTGGGTQKTQSYTFDSFGNLTNIGGTSGRATPTSSTTNRLNGAGTVYDAAGNLINWNGAVYVYDRFNQMTDMTSGSEHALYIYTVDDERVWSYDLIRNVSHWTLRDLGGKVLRDYLNNNGTWGLQSDYFYRAGLLLAAETRTGQYHYHLDHLGTPRLITSFSGTQVAYHAYYPFGEEATAFNQDTEPVKFTGHERDLASPSGAGDDLDYMHARHESPVTGRFLSSDPNLNTKRILSSPQGWNRYTYVESNPLRFVDLDGRELGLDVNMLAVPNETPAQSMAMGLAAGGLALGFAGAPGALAAGAPFSEALFAMGIKYQSVLNFFRDVGTGLTGNSQGNQISGLFGSVSRTTLQEASEAGGPTVAVFTRLSQSPEAGRGLSVATGEGAEALADSARAGGRLFKGEIPRGLLDQLEKVGLVTRTITEMHGKRATELRFLPGATQFVTKFFQPK
jgi:RHS repeat-associated protein